MANTKDKAPPIEGFSQLVAHLESGCKPKAKWRIGTEHEKFPFHRADKSPVPYEGPQGIGALLQGLADKYDWEPVREDGKVIALKGAGASITLEPAGQFELSGAPLDHVHQTCAEVGAHLKQLRDVAGALDIRFLALGFSPKWS
ncbi:MAG: glutamate-cysteine ligase family protein, partial [Pseudomonadota bacterium]